MLKNLILVVAIIVTWISPIIGKPTVSYQQNPSTLETPSWEKLEFAKNTNGFERNFQKKGIDFKNKIYFINEWYEPQIGSKRKEKDVARAKELTILIPQLIKRKIDAHENMKITTKLEFFDFSIIGIIVDCSHGNTKAEVALNLIVPFSGTSVNGMLVWDTFVIDNHSKEVVLAIRQHINVDDEFKLSNSINKLIDYMLIPSPKH